MAQTAANQVFTTVATGDIHRVLLQARRSVDSTYAKLQNSEAYVSNIENQLGIEERWTVDSIGYKRFKGGALLWGYYKALGGLEHLVVMRLFELSKLGMSGTGAHHINIPNDCDY